MEGEVSEMEVALPAIGRAIAEEPGLLERLDQAEAAKLQEALAQACSRVGVYDRSVREILRAEDGLMVAGLDCAYTRACQGERRVELVVGAAAVVRLRPPCSQNHHGNGIATRETVGQRRAKDAQLRWSADPELEGVQELVVTACSDPHETVAYRPGYLFLREGPAMVEAVRSAMRYTPRPLHVLIVDGAGQAHPRAFGLACYVGAALGVASIGITKTPPPAPGRFVELRADPARKPIYVSAGYGLSIDMAVELTKLLCATGRRLPEPIRVAHALARRRARSIADLRQP
jgi:hypothetical protein